MPGVETTEYISGTASTLTAKNNYTYVFTDDLATLNLTPVFGGMCSVLFHSGSTPTVLTVSSAVEWPGWFDPTSLAPNTYYEIIITHKLMIGYLGAVGVWG